MGQKKHKPCNGTGKVTVDYRDGVTKEEHCSGCDGTGRVSSGAKREAI